ncbi:MAG: YceI family protein [Chloroflexi bacterium]|nr:YceI family protein [Chloroflexota bacterium]
MSADTQTAVSTWNIDPAHSVVELAVKHMMFSTVKGRFSNVVGTITLDERNLANSAVSTTIDAASIATGETNRDGHLRSADFLDVDSFPQITFESTGVVPRSGTSFAVVGNLTLRGITQEVSLEAELTGKGTDPWGGQRAGFTAATTINRKDFGLTWNQALEAGGVLVSEQVKIALEIQATQQA